MAIAERKNDMATTADLTSNVPLTIAAHGTRDADGVAQCRSLADKVASRLPGIKVTLGFVELAEPSISEAVGDALKGREITGDSDGVVVPLMLATGGHVREDIPESFDEGRGEADIRYARTLLPSPLIQQALQERIAEALDRDEDQWLPQETTCVLIGRGNLVSEANAEHFRLCRMIWEKMDLERVEPAFIQVCRPSVPEALNAAAANGADHIVVAQNFLFNGRLRTWVHEQVDAWAQAHPEVQVRIADVIGDCDILADLVVQRYREALDVDGVEDGAPGYLSSLYLDGRDVLVVGGGSVAARRIPAFLAAGAKVRVVAPNLGIKVGRMAAKGTITWEQRPACPEDVEGAWYVLAATNDPCVNAMIAEAAEAAHTFCVRSDKSRLGSASTPATTSAGGLSVAVVGDRNPQRSVSVRDELIKILQG